MSVQVQYLATACPECHGLVRATYRAVRGVDSEAELLEIVCDGCELVLWETEDDEYVLAAGSNLPEYVSDGRRFREEAQRLVGSPTVQAIDQARIELAMARRRERSMKGRTDEDSRDGQGR